ncbi:MAG: esterase/lipase family protein [Acidimicrobiales bacterium]
MAAALAPLVAAVVFAGGARASAPAASPGPLPVSYNFLANAIAYGYATNAPGANNWACKPSARHPEPVVLVHGTGGDGANNWPTYSALLADTGYCVFSLTYGLSPALAATHIPIGGMNSIESSAAQLGAFIAQVRHATGATKVDLLGHSQGTLMPDYYVKFLGGAPYVDKYVSLAPLWHGTYGNSAASELATWSKMFGYSETSLPVCAACGEMVSGSTFLTKMRAGGVAVKGVTYTNIITNHDELVVPYTSGIEPGMRNIVVQDACPLDLAEHLEIASDPIGAVDVLNALDPAHPRPVPCELVLPAVGPLG